MRPLNVPLFLLSSFGVRIWTCFRGKRSGFSHGVPYACRWIAVWKASFAGLGANTAAAVGGPRLPYAVGSLQGGETQALGT